jgi:hypothetical protein
MELHAGIEREKERLGEARGGRGVGNVDDQDGATLAVALGEVCRLGFDVAENLLKLWPAAPFRTIVLTPIIHAGR